MFGQDDKGCAPGAEPQSSNPMRTKLLQQIIAMLSALPDKEHKPEGGALEIEVGKMGHEEPKNTLG